MRGNGNQINSSESDKRNLSIKEKRDLKNKPDLSTAQPTFKPIFNSISVYCIPTICHPGEGYPLQYSRLENSMDCTVHGVAKSQT